MRDVQAILPIFAQFSLQDERQSFTVTISPDLTAGQQTRGCPVAIFGPGLVLLCAQLGQEIMSSSGNCISGHWNLQHISCFWI